MVSHFFLERYCNLGQSMVSRFIRMGVHFIEFDKQERIRPEIYKLFNWRYFFLIYFIIDFIIYKQNRSLKKIENNVMNQDFGTISLFSKPNPGFVHPIQMVNVPGLLNFKLY